MDLSWFDWFQAALAAYLLYSAVRGKGQLFDNPHTKCPREQYVKVMRVLSVVSGVILLGSAILRLTGVISSQSVLGWVVWALGLLSIAAVFVYNMKMTDRKAAEAEQKRAYEATRSKDPLRAAFVFDEEDEEEEKSGDASAPNEAQPDDTEQNGNP
ncbi:MAG: hypothetical protein ABFC62_04885 [Clostridiaceae bacterium]|nr:hypothetical protein [Eubacteriales bacterium]